MAREEPDGIYGPIWGWHLGPSLEPRVRGEDSGTPPQSTLPQSSHLPDFALVRTSRS